MTPRRPILATASRRVLYAGADITLPGLLQDALKSLDCFVVGSPAPLARLFIKSDIKYALLLFDETEEGVELERFTRSLKHREGVPVIFVRRSEGSAELLAAVRRRLGSPRTR